VIRHGRLGSAGGAVTLDDDSITIGAQWGALPPRTHFKDDRDNHWGVQEASNLTLILAVG
jgi:hypothetical protein